MYIDDYAWNNHEQQIKTQTEFIYIHPKIKIMDNKEFRYSIARKLEQLPQRLLAEWSLRVASDCLPYLDPHLQNDLRIQVGIETLENRINGTIRAFDLRKVGFIVNELAKESITETSKYAARSFAQAIATGHMRGHALVSSDYALKLINSISNDSFEAATKERERQLSILEEIS